jgi:hypothetical protein
MPFQFGDLCVCYIEIPGFAHQSSVIAVTEVTEFSTKTPMLFTGDILRLGSTSLNDIADYEMAINGLYQLKAFPNETIVLPRGCYDLVENLKWIKMIDPRNTFINMKLKMLGGDKVKSPK